jgi:Cu(I)/Ag(I) efflux system membrane fusion protein
MPAQMPGMERGQPTSAPTTASTQVPGYTELTIAPAIQQRIGVTVGQVELAPLQVTIRTVGIVRPNETKVAHIHIKTEGWVEKLFVDYTGQKVAAGDPLLAIYSPQFLIAQDEYLTALRGAKKGQSEIFGQQGMTESSRRKMELWDVPPEEIQAIEQTGKATRTLALRTLIGGTVLEKKVFVGQYVMPQDELFMVADLSTVWVQAKVFEYELPHVQVGQSVTVTLPDLAGQELSGKVVFISPTVDEMARTVDVRVELPNPDGLLKPGMFSQVVLTHPMGEGLVVPDSAIIRTGERDLAFRAEPEDRFVPVEVKISPLKFGAYFQVLAGLKAGDRVVTSANFLIDSESRLRAGGGGMAGMAGMEMEGTKGQGSGADHPAGGTKEADAKASGKGGTDHSKMKH